jgi:hypothetical protein
LRQKIYSIILALTISEKVTSLADRTFREGNTLQYHHKRHQD